MGKFVEIWKNWEKYGENGRKIWKWSQKIRVFEIPNQNPIYCELKMIAIYFFYLQEIFGLDGAFWLFASISCVGLCFVILFVPETKGKDLEEMDPTFTRTIVMRWEKEVFVEYLV